MRQHVVGAFRGFDSEHAAVGDYGSLSDVKRPGRRQQGQPARDICLVTRRRRKPSDMAKRCEDLRGNLVGAD
jgi:hypothetical protein